MRVAEGDEPGRPSACTGGSVSDLIPSVVERARDLPADGSLVLDEAQWARFVALLDEPARPDPRLVELFARPDRLIR